MNKEAWSELHVKPKGVKVVLDLCPDCTKARLPQPPEIELDPALEDCKNALQVAAFLLWEFKSVDEIYLPTRRTGIVTTKINGDRWRVLEIYEDTDRGNWQLSNAITHLSNSYSHYWNESYDVFSPAGDTRDDLMRRVEWCCQQLLDNW
jgi:hypothetical protein